MNEKLFIEGGDKVFDGNEGHFEWPIITPEVEKVVLKQLYEDVSIYDKSGIFQVFEDNFAKYHESKHALLFNSGTSALLAAFEALNLDSDDEVICPALTFFATSSPLPYMGIKTVLCDCKDDGDINPNKIESLITDKTKALVITHMWGMPCDMDEILKICKKYNIALIEDCSHAHGAKYKNKTVGTFGDIACWSLQGKKIISGGEGGVLVTNNDEYYYRALLLGHYNKRSGNEIPEDNALHDYRITGLGLKLRAHPIAIAMAHEQMSHLDDWVNQKQLFVDKIKDGLKEIPYISFPDIKDKNPSWYAFTMLYDSSNSNVSREEFVDLLHSEGLSEVTIPDSTVLLNNLPIYKNYHKVIKRLREPKNPDPFDTSKFEVNKTYNSIIKMPIWVRPQDESIIDKYIQGFIKVHNNTINN